MLDAIEEAAHQIESALLFQIFAVKCTPMSVPDRIMDVFMYLVQLASFAHGGRCAHELCAGRLCFTLPCNNFLIAESNRPGSMKSSVAALSNNRRQRQPSVAAASTYFASQTDLSASSARQLITSTVSGPFRHTAATSRLSAIVISPRDVGRAEAYRRTTAAISRPSMAVAGVAFRQNKSEMPAQRSRRPPLSGLKPASSLLENSSPSPSARR